MVMLGTGRNTSAAAKCNNPLLFKLNKGTVKYICV